MSRGRAFDDEDRKVAQNREGTLLINLKNASLCLENASNLGLGGGGGGPEDLGGIGGKGILLSGNANLGLTKFCQINKSFLIPDPLIIIF